jgi:hypothetical protein
MKDMQWLNSFGTSTPRWPKTEARSSGDNEAIGLMRLAPQHAAGEIQGQAPARELYLCL